MTISRDATKNVCFNIDLTRLIKYPKIIVCQRSNPSLTRGIQLSHGEDICKRVIVCVHIKLSTIQIFVEPISNCPFECQELQLLSWVIPFSIRQTSTCKSNHPLVILIIPLIENCTQTQITGIGLQLERFLVISISEYGGTSVEFF